MRALLRVFDALLPLAVGLFLYSAAPLRTGYQFGADEGYELMKGLLVSRGYSLYSEVWSDQPPLYTEILGLLFRAFGPEALVARCLTLTFAVLLAAALYAIVRQSSGRLGGVLAVLLMSSSSSFIELGISAMLELPAMSLVMGAFWAVSDENRKRSTWWLVTSGALFGCALQIKLTVGMFLPALVLQWLIKTPTHAGAVTRSIERRFLEASRSGFRSVISGIGGLGITFALIALLCYDSATLQVFWKSHFSHGTRESVELSHRWHPGLLKEDFALVVTTIGCLFFAAASRHHNFLVPVVMLACATFVHLWHRPYWNYYILHFTVPMVWLSAVGLSEWLKVLLRVEYAYSRFSKIKHNVNVLVWSASAAMMIICIPEKLKLELHRVQLSESASQQATVRMLKPLSPQAEWIVTDERLAAFWARIPITPELAIIPSKRLWSKQITHETFVRSLEDHVADLVLLPESWRAEFGLTEYLKSRYKAIITNEVRTLYIRQQ